MYFLIKRNNFKSFKYSTSNGSNELIDNQNFKNNLDSAKIAKLDQSIKQNIKESHLNETSKSLTS